MKKFIELHPYNLRINEEQLSLTLLAKLQTYKLFTASLKKASIHFHFKSYHEDTSFTGSQTIFLLAFVNICQVERPRDGR